MDLSQERERIAVRYAGEMGKLVNLKNHLTPKTTEATVSSRHNKQFKNTVVHVHCKANYKLTVSVEDN